MASLNISEHSMVPKGKLVAFVLGSNEQEHVQIWVMEQQQGHFLHPEKYISLQDIQVEESYGLI